MINAYSWPQTMSNVATNLYRSFGYTTVHDRADALHGAILRLLTLQNKSGLRLPDDDLKRWLHCVASRMLLDARRMQLRTTSLQDVTDTITMGESETERDYPIHSSSMKSLPFQGLDISFALQSLSPSLRASFELHSQGFNADEIATTLGMSREAVHKRIQRARREMQLRLHAYL